MTITLMKTSNVIAIIKVTVVIYFTCLVLWPFPGSISFRLFSLSQGFLSPEPGWNMWNRSGQSCRHMGKLWLVLFQTACQLIALLFGLITTSFIADNFITWGNAPAYSFTCTGYIRDWLVLGCHYPSLAVGMGVTTSSPQWHCPWVTVTWELFRKPPPAAALTQGDRRLGALLLISIRASDRTFTCLTFFLFSALLLGRKTVQCKRAWVLQLELDFHSGSASYYNS